MALVSEARTEALGMLAGIERLAGSTFCKQPKNHRLHDCRGGKTTEFLFAGEAEQGPQLTVASNIGEN